MKFPCRQCQMPKPESEVVSRFKVRGQPRFRFKMCGECLRLARKAYRSKGKENSL